MSTMAATRQRRKDVERLMAMGWRYQVIAEELGIDIGTVRDDGHQIMRRLGVTTQLELVVATWKAGQEVLGGAMRIHECVNCAKISIWSEGWQWWGSELMVDQGLPLVKTCSDECRKAIGDPRTVLATLWKATGYMVPSKITKSMRQSEVEL